MTTITQKKKLSKGTWALIFICLIAVIGVIVAAFLGFISLQPLADLIVGYATFGSLGWINAILIITAPFAVGVLAFYIVQRYFIGTKITTAAPAGYGYNPQPTTPTQPQQGTETTIS